MYSLALTLTLTLYGLSTAYSTGPVHYTACLTCANTSGLIHIKLNYSALNKALISALNKVRMCLYRPFVFVTDSVP